MAQERERAHEQFLRRWVFSGKCLKLECLHITFQLTCHEVTQFNSSVAHKLSIEAHILWRLGAEETRAESEQGLEER